MSDSSTTYTICKNFITGANNGNSTYSLPPPFTLDQVAGQLVKICGDEVTRAFAGYDETVEIDSTVPGTTGVYNTTYTATIVSYDDYTNPPVVTVKFYSLNLTCNYSTGVISGYFFALDTDEFTLIKSICTIKSS